MSEDSDFWKASEAEVEEARRPRHWTDAVQYVCHLIAVLAVLALIGYVVAH